MKNQIKLLCVALIVMFCVSLCTLSVYATPDGEEPASSQATVASSETQATTPPQTVQTEPPSTQAPETTAPPQTQPATKAPTQATTAPRATNPPTVATQPQTQAPVYTNPPATTQPYSQTPNTSLFNSDDKRFDDNTLTKSDWDKIADDLKNNDKDEKGEPGDFDFIKNNNGIDDNGLWILIIGVVLVLAGLGIIGWWIYYSVRIKKNLNKKGNKPNGAEGNNAEPPARRHSNAPARKKPTYAEQRRINQRSKYDTDEIQIPRNRKPPHGGTRGGGTRYKPRH